VKRQLRLYISTTKTQKQDGNINFHILKGFVFLLFGENGLSFIVAERPAIRYYTKWPFGQTHGVCPYRPTLLWYNATIGSIMRCHHHKISQKGYFVPKIYVLSIQNRLDSSGWKLALAAFFGSYVEIQGILEMPCIRRYSP